MGLAAAALRCAWGDMRSAVEDPEFEDTMRLDASAGARQGGGAVADEEPEMDDEALMRLFADITAELQAQVQERLAMQAAEYERLEELALQADVAAEQARDDMVFCVVCQRHLLRQHVSVIYCPCGFRLDTGSDGVTISGVRQRLHAAVEQHESVCPAPPQFAVQQLTGSPYTALTMQCAACALFDVVL
jgi:hypothetical protein